MIARKELMSSSKTPDVKAPVTGVRINDLAKQWGIPSKEVLEKAQLLFTKDKVKSHASMLTAGQAARLQAKFGKLHEEHQQKARMAEAPRAETPPEPETAEYTQPEYTESTANGTDHGTEREEAPAVVPEEQLVESVVEQEALAGTPVVEPALVDQAAEAPVAPPPQRESSSEIAPAVQAPVEHNPAAPGEARDRSAPCAFRSRQGRACRSRRRKAQTCRAVRARYAKALGTPRRRSH